jgi:HEAT repeat protein
MFSSYFRRKYLKTPPGYMFYLIFSLIILVILSHRLESIAQSDQYFFYSLKIPKKLIPANISPAVKQAIERLYSTNPIEVERAVFDLGEMGCKASSALPFLIELLGYPNLAAVYRNGTIKEVNPGLSAAKAIGKIGNTNTAETLVIVLKDALKKDLDKAKQQRGVNRNRGGIFSDKNLTQSELEKMDPMFVIDYDTVADVPNIAQALIALNKLAVEPLITLLKEEDFETVDAAAEILGEIGDKRAVEPLINALKEKGSFGVSYISTSLGRITGQNFGEDLIKWQKWWEENKNYLR